MSTDERGMDADGWDDVAMTRRATLRAAGALGLGGWLVAQGGLAATAAAAGAAPRRGGHLRVGHVGAGKGESFNPGARLLVHRRVALLQPLRPARARQFGLLAVTRASPLQWTPNAARTTWEVKLRPASSGMTGRRSPRTT